MSSILKVDTIQDQSGNNIINESGNVITIGASGDTITVPAGATVSGFTSAGIDDNATSVAITIDSAENVGIGTTSPSRALTVSGSTSPFIAIVETGTSGSATLSFGDSSADNVGKIQYSNLTNSLAFTVNSSERMNIANSGRVGINVTSASGLLHVQSASSGASVNSSGDEIIAENSANAGISILSGNSNQGQLIFGDDGDNNVGRLQYDHSNNSMQFIVNSAERMRITSAGSVGIGTSSPASLLHVSSNGPVIKLTDTDTGATHNLSGSSSARNFDLEVDAGSTSGSPRFALKIHDGLYYTQTKTETVFNEESKDVDFRVESDASSHGLYLDGGTGNVGIGLSGPTYRLQLTSVYETADSPKVFKAFNNSAGSTSSPQYTYWDMAGHGGADRVRFISYDYSQNSGTRSRFNIQTSVDGGSLADRFVIQNDGDVTINNLVSIGTTTTNARLFVESDAASISPFRINDTSSGSTSRNCAIFQRAGTNVGFIATTNNATSFVTSSDYRLKENVSYDFDATTRLKQLKPARFNFIKDADTTVDGFLAHEVQDVVPEAISGEKDKTETKEKVVVNSYGNVIAENIEQKDWEIDKTAADKKYPTDSTWEATKVVPEYQGIDQSKLVPLLVKTIQELEARITTLEANNP